MARHMSRRHSRRKRYAGRIARTAYRRDVAALGVAGCFFLLGLLVALRAVLG